MRPAAGRLVLALGLLATAAASAACLLTTSFEGLTTADASSNTGDSAARPPPPPPPDGGAEDASCSADLQTDPKNCGRCGHDCAGGSCSAGRCGPSTLADNQGETRGIRVFDGYVYWASFTNGTIVRLPATGGAPEVVVSQPDRNIVSFAVSAEGLTWLAAKRLADAGIPGGLWTSELDGGAATLVHDAGAGSRFRGRVAVLPGTIVFTDSELDGGAVRRIDRNGGGLALLADGQPEPYGLAVVAPYVVWSAGLGAAGYVRRIALDGGASTSLADGEALPRDLGAFGTRVYWANTREDAGSVRRVELLADGGAEETTYATGLPRPWSVIEDGDRIYWADYRLGRVLTCPVSGCGAGPEIFAIGTEQATYLAADERFVYVATFLGNIYRIAK